VGKITDPDLLIRNTHLIFDTGSLRIQLSASGVLTASEGVTLQAVYSKCKELWKSQDDLIKFTFPLTAITEQKFDVVGGWDWADTATKTYIRDGGWAVKNASNVSTEEWMGFKTLGTIGDTDQVYIQQTGSITSSNTVFQGQVNEAVKIYTSGSNDYRNYFKCFVREQGKVYDQSQLSAIGIGAVTYQVYAFPLANATDTKITATDATITGSQPFVSMSITYYTGSVLRAVGGNSYHFNTIIDGNSGTKTQIYEGIQYRLRTSADIDSGSGVVIGKTADSLLKFVGDTLVGSPGVFIDNYLPADINSLEFYDTGSNKRVFPFVAAGTITFNDNMVADSNAIYKMYFTSVPLGAFGSSSAVIVNNNAGSPITGSVSGSTSVSFTFDYDFNSQGGRTSGSDAAVTIVAIGLDTAQYVKTTGTIVRSNANAFSLVSSLERNYSNI